MPDIKFKPKTYGPKSFPNLDLAYGRYVLERMRQTVNPALAPRRKFAQIWGWESKKVAKPGK
jgi:hypothetical protein